jgi:hypothetical protein
MAKGKRAVALFEVIHSDKRFKKAPEAVPQPSPEESRQMALQAVDLLRKRRSDPETWKFPKVKVGSAFAGAIASVFTGVKSGWAWGSNQCIGLARVARLAIGKANGLIPGAAIAAIFITLMLLARHFVHPSPPTPNLAQALRNGPAHPNVLNVGADSSASTPDASAEIELDERQASDHQPADQAAVSNLAQPGQRIVNMNYVLMQSYFEEKTAEEARDYLVKNGVPCTIERGVKGWRPDFYQVIGLQGFVRASSAECRAYMHNVENLGETFSPKSKYKRFQPEAIKW